MANSRAEFKSNHHFMSKAFDLAATAGLFFLEIKESIRGQLDGTLRRVQYTFILYLWISAGLFLLTLGFFDLLIDNAGVPRGVVFFIGGLFISLVAVVFLQTGKIRKKK